MSQTIGQTKDACINWSYHVRGIRRCPGAYDAIATVWHINRAIARDKNATDKRHCYQVLKL